MRLLTATTVKIVKPRSIVQLLNYYFNKVDHNRVQLVGPDRSCAEWLMRNGAFIRWRNCSDFVGHYNDLPLDENEKRTVLIDEVRAENASVTHHGFEHFLGCTCIRKMTFKKCRYFNDTCVAVLKGVVNLKDLTIAQCPEVTCHGIMQLAGFQNLEKLTLGKSDNFDGKTLEKIVGSLQTALPSCKVTSDECLPIK